MRARGAFPRAAIQKALVDQRVPDGVCGHRAADIVREKQDDLAEQDRIRDLALSAALFPFQDIADYDRGIDAVQQSQRPLLI